MKKSKRRIWIEKIDKVFSRFIKLRDKVGGHGRCYTCGTWKPIDEMDAGHFVQRDKMATRWDETNVQLQDRYCNRFRGGMSYEFGKKLDSDFGVGTADRIKQKAAQIYKPTLNELEDLYDYYVAKVLELE